MPIDGMKFVLLYFVLARQIEFDNETYSKQGKKEKCQRLVHFSNSNMDSRARMNVNKNKIKLYNMNEK